LPDIVVDETVPKALAARLTAVGGDDGEDESGGA